MAVIGTDIERAKSILNQNGLVGIPTETVYGLAGNALNSEAVTKIFEVKRRPYFDPLIIHTNKLERIESHVEEIPELLRTLAQKFMPGPLTILLKKKESIPDIITSGSDKVAIRIPNHSLTLSLLERLDFPLAAPSANPFGYISPTTAIHVDDQLGDQIEYILDGGKCQVGLESTIIECEGDTLTVLRKGGISIEQLSEFCENIEIRTHSSSNPSSPGMLKSHYSPRVPVIINPSFESISNYNIERIGVLAFTKSRNLFPIENQLILSKSGDLIEAAQNLFSYMRILDKMDIDLIISEVFPNEGLGRAINDKLRRASQKEL